MRKNARNTAMPNAVSDFQITDGDDFKVTISAKDFPDAGENGEFRVYRVYGDVTRPERLKNAIMTLLASHGIESRAVKVTL